LEENNDGLKNNTGKSNLLQVYKLTEETEGNAYNVYSYIRNPEAR